MAKLKQQNPTIDFGFYASIPRLVRTNYRDKVTPIMKWLYTCLKDLCGDDGTCYRTLRVLSEETGISTGLLSESIPILHEVGLIHAEKKKRSTGGKEVWHITIVDIWIANGKAHPTKRSQDEQTQASENVHNTNVHNVNETTGECSCGERECSQILDRRKNTLSKNNTEERKDISVSDDNANLPPKFQAIFDQMQKEIASLKAELSTKAQELPTNNTQDNQPSTQVNKQASYSQETIQKSLLPDEPPQQPASTKGKGNRGRKPKQVEVPELTEEEKARLETEKLAQEALKERHKAIFSRIVARRGYELTDQKDIIVEWTHVHKLADKFKDNQIEAIHKHLFEKHPYWSKPEHKYSIGAYIIWKQSGEVAQILRDQRLEEEKKSAQPQSVSGYRNYTLNPSSESSRTGETQVVAKQEEHPGPGPRRLLIRRVSDIQAVLESRHETVAVAQ